MKLRAIIADDEPLARARVRRLLEEDDGVEVVAECADGAEAAERIRALQPDVVFLDIEMPELDGFEVVASAGRRPPSIVFVTAYDAYAVRAFEEQAIDYVLKPVERERLQRTLALVRERHPSMKTSDAPRLDRIVVRSRGRVVLITPDEITHLEAAGNYVRVHTASHHHLIRQTLAELEKSLDGRFVRIHRSTIVNASAVREIVPSAGGDAVVVLGDGRELTLSRTWRAAATERLTRS